mgnify:CR=1 FL=1
MRTDTVQLPAAPQCPRSVHTTGRGDASVPSHAKQLIVNTAAVQSQRRHTSRCLPHNHPRHKHTSTARAWLNTNSCIPVQSTPASAPAALPVPSDAMATRSQHEIMAALAALLQHNPTFRSHLVTKSNYFTHARSWRGCSSCPRPWWRLAGHADRPQKPPRHQQGYQATVVAWTHACARQQAKASSWRH